jgi:arginase
VTTPVLTGTHARPEPARRIGVLGVPTSAGSHNPGQDKAPGAWRSAGLLSRLEASGIDVRDFGDLPVRRHRPSRRSADGVRDLERVVDVVRQVSDAVHDVHEAGFTPLVLGGDCTITLGALAGLARTRNVGLVYFDGDADLNRADHSNSGVLDTMGMTHLLGGGVPELSTSGPRHPLLQDDQVALVGFDPAELDTAQWATLAARHLHATPAPAVRRDPAGAADAALRHVETNADAVLVHFDVDVIDSGAFPLANFPHFAGLDLDEAATCLSRFCNGQAFAGLVVTEVNPDHDPDGDLLPALLDVTCSALAGLPR